MLVPHAAIPIPRRHRTPASTKVRPLAMRFISAILPAVLQVHEFAGCKGTGRRHKRVTRLAYQQRAGLRGIDAPILRVVNPVTCTTASSTLGRRIQVMLFTSRNTGVLRGSEPDRQPSGSRPAQAAGRSPRSKAARASKMRRSLRATRTIMAATRSWSARATGALTGVRGSAARRSMWRRITPPSYRSECANNGAHESAPRMRVKAVRLRRRPSEKDLLSPC